MAEEGNENILVVDDDEQITDIFSKMLTYFGYSVTISNNGLDALKRFGAKGTEFDLVITDQTMPDISGVQLAEEIRSIRKEMPVILCSGSDEAENITEENRKYITRSITKPVSMEDLTSAVREVLDQNNTIQPLRL